MGTVMKICYFDIVSEKLIKQFIVKSQRKSSVSDAAQSAILKRCVDSVLLSVCSQDCKTGIFTRNFKHDIVTLTLKKPGCELELKKIV